MGASLFCGKAFAARRMRLPGGIHPPWITPRLSEGVENERNEGKSGLFLVLFFFGEEDLHELLVDQVQLLVAVQGGELLLAVYLNHL
jgi:hypothetical protein